MSNKVSLARESKLGMVRENIDTEYGERELLACETSALIVGVERAQKLRQSVVIRI